MLDQIFPELLGHFFGTSCIFRLMHLKVTYIFGTLICHGDNKFVSIQFTSTSCEIAKLSVALPNKRAQRKNLRIIINVTVFIIPTTAITN